MARGCYVEAVDRLLIARADVNTTNAKAGPTALHNAAIADHSKVIERLLPAKANVNIVAQGNHTAIQYAIARGYSAIADLLRAAGAIERCDTRAHRTWRLSNESSETGWYASGTLIFLKLHTSNKDHEVQYATSNNNVSFSKAKVKAEYPPYFEQHLFSEYQEYDFVSARPGYEISELRHRFAAPLKDEIVGEWEPL